MNKTPLILLAFLLTPFPNGVFALLNPRIDPPPEISAAFEDDLTFLKRFLLEQIVPNQIVPNPHKDRHNLILSYKHPPVIKDYERIYSQSATYDNAVSIIALVMLGENQRAAAIIDGLMKTVQANGDLWFIVNTHDAWPTKEDHRRALVRTGASSWAGYAVTFFLLAELVHNPTALTDQPHLGKYLAFAELIAAAVLRRQIIDPEDARCGLLTGGDHRIALKLEDGELREKYYEGKIEWASVEHNIDSFFFLRDLGYITGKKKYQTAADLVRNGLLRNHNSGTGHFNRGVSRAGSDPLRALDCASWGAMFLLAVDQPDLAWTTLLSAEDYFNTSNGIHGYRPYIDTTIYEGNEAQNFYYPGSRLKWNDIPFVWSEGSLGVALAYMRMGKSNKGKEIISSMLDPKMNLDGGLRYADRELEHQFTTSHATIGTAWAILAIKNMQGGQIPKLFWTHKLPDLPAR